MRSNWSAPASPVEPSSIPGRVEAHARRPPSRPPSRPMAAPCQSPAPASHQERGAIASITSPGVGGRRSRTTRAGEPTQGTAAHDTNSGADLRRRMTGARLADHRQRGQPLTREHLAGDNPSESVLTTDGRDEVRPRRPTSRNLREGAQATHPLRQARVDRCRLVDVHRGTWVGLGSERCEQPGFRPPSPQQDPRRHGPGCARHGLKLASSLRS